MALTLEAELRASIVERAAHGDEMAFARLVTLYHADMMRVAYLTCGDQGLAEDAVQAAWTIAWRKLRQVREPDHVKSWLVAVAANEARHHARRQRRGSVVEIRLDDDGASWQDTSRHDRDGRDPGDLIDRVDLVNALDRLRPDDRALLALRYVAGLNSTELAERLRMSPSGTRARLARLLRRLRKDLDHG